MKVKIWDSKRKEFIAYAEIPHIHAICLNETSENIITGNNNFFISICTRLRDNFKKILYQDDIIQLSSPIFGTWKSSIFCNPTSEKFYTESHPQDSNMIEITPDNIKTFNIKKIGNIFENSELLINKNFMLN